MIRRCLFACLVLLFAVPVRSQSTALVHAGDLVSLGSFTLPNEHDGFSYGGGAVAFNAARSSLFAVGWASGYAVGEYGIPAIGDTAPVLQTLSDAWEGTRGNIGVSDNRVGGLLVQGGSLLSTIYAYYDAGSQQTATHFVRPVTLATTGQVKGPVQVGTAHNAGYYDGYMAPVPAEWQAALGATAVTGNCCIPIISRTSFGPSLFAFDPVGLKVTSDLLWYDGVHPLDVYGAAGSHPLFNGATSVSGVAIIPGTASVLFFGTTGTGPYCYGTGADCNDPANAAKGEHAYPYTGYVWAYDMHDLLAVKSGAKDAWSVRPYATWSLPFPVSGATYDPSGQRLYLMHPRANGAYPVVEVMSVGAGTPAPAPTPTPLPTPPPAPTPTPIPVPPSPSSSVCTVTSKPTFYANGDVGLALRCPNLAAPAKGGTVKVTR